MGWNVVSDHLQTALDKAGEGFTLEHAVLQKGKVDKLVYKGVVLGIAGQDVILLLLFGLDVVATLFEVVLFFLGDFFWLLLVLLLTEYSLTCAETLDFGLDGLQCI